MTTGPMTEERFDYLTERMNIGMISDEVWEWQELAQYPFEMWPELLRLRAELAAKDAEVERLRAAIGRIDAVGEVSICEYVACRGDAEGRGHLPGCIYRITYDALNPEPASCTDYSEVDGNGCILPSGHDGNHRLNPEPAS